MGHPELNSDESVILDTQNVVVKSVPFEAILTSERLILLNSRDTLLPPRYIPLAAIRGIETGENAIRDPVITLSVLTESGGPRPMVLTFSKAGGGERRRESDEWVKILRERLATIQKSMAPAVASTSDVEPVARPEPTAPGQISTGRPAKKKIEIARPIKKITENPPAMPKPVETTSLPQGSFCGRCGNRVPPGSTFCNKCGTKVFAPGEQPETQEPAVAHVSVPIPPVVVPSAESRERPIEQVIHSIEPLIEDSKPRTKPAPLVPSRIFHQHPEPAPVPVEAVHETPSAAAPAPVPAPTAETEPDPTQKSLAMFSNILSPSLTAKAGTDTTTAIMEGVAAATEPTVATAPTPSTVPQVSIPPVPQGTPLVQPPAPPARKKSKLLPVAIIVIVIIAIAGIAFVFLGHGGGATLPLGQPTTIPITVSTTVPTTIPTTASTPEPTATVATPIPTPAPIAIPQNGVWVHVKYDGKFTGSYGTPGNQQAVTDTGDHVYQVATATGVVAASFTKGDGSAQPILLEVFKDGTLVQSDTSTTPKGTAQIQIDLKSTIATLVPETTAPAPATTTATANATA